MSVAMCDGAQQAVSTHVAAGKWNREGLAGGQGKIDVLSPVIAVKPGAPK